MNTNPDQSAAQQPRAELPATVTAPARSGRRVALAKSRSLTTTRGAPKPSKQDRVLSLLRRKHGVTVATIMKATDWQKHSVHGFLAGVVRKKLKLNLKADAVGGNRRYRIVSGKPAKGTSSKTPRGR